jgi:RNA polymerase sigma-70 factor (ECF subfamily)
VRSDFELLDAWGEADRRAGSELFERHFVALFGFFRARLADGADDLMQQTFLACVEGRARFERRASFRTYLFATARNILLAELRKRRRAPQPPDAAVESIADWAPSPSRVLAVEGDRRLLLEALRRIPIDYQIALELYHWEGMSAREVGEVLGLAEPGARSRIRRATAALRTELERMASTPEQLASTLAGLTDWARELREHLAGEHA